MSRRKMPGLTNRGGVWHIDKRIKGFGRLSESCRTTDLKEAERFLTHRLEEILDITNRITVLKDGVLVNVVETSKVDEQALATMMVGRDLEDYYPDRVTEVSNVVLQIKGFTTKDIVRFKPASTTGGLF